MQIVPQVPCTLFIWYPNKGNVGHSSMLIGNYDEIASCYPEMIMTQKQMRNFQELSQEQMAGLSWPTLPYYVSWWPDGAHSLTKLSIHRMKGSGTPVGIMDCLYESSPPHVSYTITGLSSSAMMEVWMEIRKGTGKIGTYNLLRANCSTVIAKCLKAGGVEKLLGHSISRPGKIWSPKELAVIGNNLRNKGYAQKNKHQSCPKKSSSPFSVMFRLR